MDKESAQIIADAISSLASATRDLGTGNAATDMGALEFIAVEIREASERIEAGLNNVAEAMRDISSALGQ